MRLCRFFRALCCEGKPASKISIARLSGMTIGIAYASQNLSCPKGLKAYSTRSTAAAWAERAEASIEQIFY